MIKTYDLVPHYYYEKSRDFQFFGRLFDVLVNYAKTNIDLMLKNDEDTRLLDLLSTTLGFELRHDYILKDLYNVCTCFIQLLKSKGTRKAIETAVNILLNSQGIEAISDVIITNKGDENNPADHNIRIVIPYTFKDTLLLEDLLDYILPAGYTYTIIFGTIFDFSEYYDIYTFKSAINAYGLNQKVADNLNSISAITQTGTKDSQLFGAYTTDPLIYKGIEDDYEDELSSVSYIGDITLNVVYKKEE